ncbi:MAG: methyl-accepting chemotaxis protein [Treponema sp.]|nr:methyl-accepting chemotaxis protein [Treponema sp.]
MRKRHPPLSLQIIILCLSLVLVISFTITAIFYVNINRITEENIREKAGISIQYMTSHLVESLTPFYDLMQSGSAYFNVLPSRDVMNDVMKNILAAYPDLVDIYYGSVTSMYAPGGIWISGDGWYPETDPEWDYTWDPPGRLWHQVAMANPDKVMLVDPYIDAETKKLVVTFSRTVRDASGNITGVIAADVLLDKFSEFVTSEKITGDGTTSMIDRTGLFLVHPDQSYILEKNLFTEMPSIDKNTILSNDENIVISGNTYIGSAPVGDTGWILVSTGSLDSLQAGVKQLLWTVIFVILIFAVVAGVISVILSYYLTNPFRRLVTSFNVISAGDFTSAPPDYSSREASALSAGFESFTLSISGLILKIKESAGDIGKVTEDLSVSVKDTQAVIAQVTGTFDSIRDDVGLENKSIVLNETSVTQVMQEIENLNVKIREQSAQISGASSAIEEMVANIHSIEKNTVQVDGSIRDLVNNSHEQKKRLSETAEATKLVEKESQNLAMMNKVISDVATQTNLLSMNAAIEAAHAGESGRGFAVVAQEIRKLAETTAQQSRSSEEAIKSLQERIREIAVSAGQVDDSFSGMISMINHVEEITAALRNAAEEQGVGSNQLLSSISVINEITGNIETASQAMQASAGEAVTACRNLTKLSHSVNDKVTECLGGIKSLTVNSDTMAAVVENTRTGVGQLEKSISPFKIRS